MAEIVTAASNLSVEQFADSISAYAASHCLPSSYGLLASTFVANKTSITLDEVILRVAAEHRRRESKGETVNESGLLATRAQVVNDAVKVVKATEKRRVGNLWCEHHKSTSHNTADCRTDCQGLVTS